MTAGKAEATMWRQSVEENSKQASEEAQKLEEISESWRVNILANLAHYLLDFKYTWCHSVEEDSKQEIEEEELEGNQREFKS